MCKDSTFTLELFLLARNYSWRYIFLLPTSAIFLIYPWLTSTRELTRLRCFTMVLPLDFTKGYAYLKLFRMIALQYVAFLFAWRTTQLVLQFDMDSESNWFYKCLHISRQRSIGHPVQCAFDAFSVLSILHRCC